MCTCICPPTTYITGGTINSIGTIQNIGKLGSIGAIDEIKKIENIEPIRFCHANFSEAGKGGSLAEAAFYSAALIAVATINTIAQWQIAWERYEIAKEYANIAKDRWNRFRTGYMPLEIEMLNDLHIHREYHADYLKARRHYTDWFRAAYAEGSTRLGRCARLFRTKVDDTLANDLTNASQTSVVDGVNFGYRYEEYREITRTDDYWNRRSNMLNLGRDLLAQSAKYADSANNLLAGLSGIANQGAQGAMGMLGYLQERSETNYPQQFTGIGALGDGSGVSLFAPASMGLRWS